MRGHLEKLGERRYKVIVEAGKNAEGGRARRGFTVRGTKREAERELARIVREIDTGAFCDPTHTTVGEYLDRWLADYGRHNPSGHSYDRYEGIVRVHLKPAMGGIALAKLTPAHIQSFYDARLGEGLSAGSVRKIHAVLHSALRRALRLQMIPRNPADCVDVPVVRPRERIALDETQTAQLLHAAEYTALHAPIFVAVFTGLRRGELLGLRWHDIDLENGVLRVVRTLEEAGKRLSFKEPKTPKSRRPVALGPSVIALLHQHYSEYEHAREQFGPEFNREGLVFPNADGEPWSPPYFSICFRRLAKRAGFPGLCLHGLRHTHASQLSRACGQPKVVQERLGHATMAITSDLYTHVLPGMQEQAVEMHDAALARALAGTTQQKNDDIGHQTGTKRGLKVVVTCPDSGEIPGNGWQRIPDSNRCYRRERAAS